jgi:hypothetical protein
MKIIICLSTLLAFSILAYSQNLDDSTRIKQESRIQQLENKLDDLGFHLNEASHDLNRMFWFTLAGTTVSATLGLLTTKENKKISFAVFIPFIIGDIIGIINYFYYKDDIEEAGKRLREIKK